MTGAAPERTITDAPAAADNRRCAACGAAFHCGAAEATCWCVLLPPLPSSAIDANGGCLCPACLHTRVGAAAAAPGDRP